MSAREKTAPARVNTSKERQRDCAKRAVPLFVVHSSFSGEQISAKALKQQMNKWRYVLEERGVYFLSHRSNGERILEVRFVPPFSDASAVSDAENGSAKSCDPCVPCVTDGSVIR